jgi:flagellar basal-body rod protein FlgB
MQFIDPATLQLVSRALDASALRHQAIAQNIANVHVEGARPVRVRFEELLGAMPQQIAAGQGFKVEDVPSARIVTDLSGARVELDAEMAALSSNGLQYQALVKALNRQLSIVSVAVQEGRR